MSPRRAVACASRMNGKKSKHVPAPAGDVCFLCVYDGFGSCFGIGGCLRDLYRVEKKTI